MCIATKKCRTSLRASHTYATSDSFGATRQFLMLFLSICLVYAKCEDETVQQSDKRQCLCKVEEFLFSVACRCCLANQGWTPRNNMADLWSDEEMGKLIDLYQEEENLYNYRIREYRDRDRARESLLRISRAMGKNWDGNAFTNLLRYLCVFSWIFLTE